MGLDIYLYKCPDRKHANAMVAAWEKENDALWEKHAKLEEGDKITPEAEAQFVQDRLQLAEKYEIVDYNHKSVEQIYEDSKTEPDHLFKLGYLRSSYNGSGINRLLALHGLPGLFEIFQVEGEDYQVVPDWEAAKKICEETIEKLREHAEGPLGKYNVMDFTPSLLGHDSSVTSPEEALEFFNMKMLKTITDSPFDSFSTREGLFFKTPLKVVGVIPYSYPEKEKTKLASDYWANRMAKTSYLVYELEDRAKFFGWYLTALKIVLENINYVLGQEHPEHFYMTWSG